MQPLNAVSRCSSLLNKSRIAPGIATSLTSIFGAIITSLYFRSPYGAIPFGIAFTASIYHVHLAWEYKNLKNYEAYNAALLERIQFLEKQLEKLDGLLEEYKAQNLQYKELLKEMEAKLAHQELLNQEYSANNANLTRSNQELTSSLSTLHDENSELAATKDALKTELASHKQAQAELTQELAAVKDLYKQELAHLGALHQALQQTGKDQSLTIEQLIKTLSQQMGIFGEQNGKLGAATASSQKGQEQILAIVNSLTTLLDRVSRLEQDIRSNLAAETKQHLQMQASIAEEIGKYKAQLKLMREEVEKLEKIRLELRSSLHQFRTEVVQLGKENIELSKIKRDLQQILQIATLGNVGLQ